MKENTIAVSTEDLRERNITDSFVCMNFMNTADVRDLYGCHIKTAQRILRELRISLNKKSKTPVSLEEFARHTGISLKMLQDLKKWKFKE